MAEILMSLHSMPSKFSMDEDVVRALRPGERPLRRLGRLSRDWLNRVGSIAHVGARQRRPTSAAAW